MKITEVLDRTDWAELAQQKLSLIEVQADLEQAAELGDTERRATLER